jgi:predicted CopG family antitoxin
MQRKLTITVSEDVYQGLYRVVGRRRISSFLDQLARPHVVPADLNAAYQEMAADEAREREALEWSEALVGDVAGPEDAAR